MDDGRANFSGRNIPLGARARAPIAIIGVAGRYPGGAHDVQALWANLISGVDGVGEAKGDRWDLGYHNADPDQPGRIYSRAAGFIDGVDLFDAEFFGLSPRETAYIDPQQRLLLELAWEALEDAKMVPRRLAGTDTGVFVGIASHDYADMQANLDKSQGSAYTNSGGALSIAANRISYIFDFHGPSFAVDTACSSALVAIHSACVSLWTGECSLALGAGVNLLLQPKPSIGFCKASMISRRGRCQSFDANGDGYVRSEGGGVVVLKLLADAERDGDPIRAVILGSGVNSDGRTHGLSMPNEFAQEALLRQIYSECGISPEQVYYVEAHGTGTPVGDPIECNAIGRVLGVTRQDGSNCLVGSIKSNIGHLETASGVAGLTKVLLALEHRQLPGNLHFNTPNPKIPFADLKLEVVDRPTPLPDRDLPLIMGVSSYGFGGTNAHVVVQEYRKPAKPSVAASKDARKPQDHVLLLSARSGDALTAMAASHAALLRATDPADLGNLCATAALLRSQHPHRLAVTGGTPEELAKRLDAFVAGEPTPRLATARVTADHPKIAFVFSGNGPQWWGMGRELLADSPLFRAEIERVDAVFRVLSGWSLIAEMARPEAEQRMEKTEIAQPMLFALQLGLTALLKSEGVEPASVVGHSVGEVAAAYVSGALSLEQAVRVIYERSRAQGLTAGDGKMAAVGMSWEETAELLAGTPGWIEISAENSARAVTVAGDPEALALLEQKVTEAGAFFRILALDYAFHSRAMDKIEAPLLAALDGLAPVATRLPFVSTVQGCAIAGETLAAEYWWHNIRKPVRFAGAIEHLLNETGANVFLEIGPHPVLRDYVQQCARERDAAAAVVPTLRRPTATRAEPEFDNFWNAVCACYANGVVDLDGIYVRPAEPVALPAYPWQRRSYWSGVTPLPDTPVYARRDHPMLGYRAASAEPEWEITLDMSLLPFLADHVVQGATVFPATGFIEMILSGATRALGAGNFELEDFDIRKALVIPAGEMPIVQLAINEEDGTAKIRSRMNRDTETWTLHVVGKIGRAPGGAAPAALSVRSLRERMTKTIDHADHYRAASALGLNYGPAFQGISSVAVGNAEALGTIAVPEELAGALGDYALHPCLFDACLQTLLGLADESGLARTAYLPVQIARLRYFAGKATPAFCHVRIVRLSARSMVADIRILDRDGQIVAEIDEFRFVGVDFLRSAGVPLYSIGWRIVDDKGATGRPAQLPSPTVLAERLAPTISELVQRFDRVRFYQDVDPRFERLAAACAGRALDELGAREAPFTLVGLMARAGVTDEHRQYLSCLIDIAEADGLIDRTSDGWTMAADAELPDLETLWRDLFYDYPSMYAELALVARAGEHMSAVMRGEVQALQLLFPDKGAGPTDHVYDSSPSLQIYNHIARAAVAEIIRARPAGRRLRILELGGGTGGLAASLLPILPPEQTDYLFTDVSPAFLARAEHRFSAYRFLRFGLVNIERNPLDQGQSAGSFDLIVAADVLHVASDLRQALGHIKTLLAPGGQLLVIEKHREWMGDVIFGQLKGWWAFADRDLRKESALLSPGEWEKLLASSGFIEPTILSDAEALTGDMDDRETQHSVLLAQTPVSAAAGGAIGEVATGSRRWLFMVSDDAAEKSFAEASAEALRLAGHSVIEVELGSTYARPAADRFVVATEAADHYDRLLRELAEEGLGFSDIVHLAGITPMAERSGDALMALQDERCLSTVLLVQALSRRDGETLPRLTLATSMAVAHPTGTGPTDPGQSPLWGVGHVLMNEHSNLSCRLIDVQFDLADPAAAQALAAELTREDGEADVLLRPGERYIARVWATSAAEEATLARHRTVLRQSEDETPPFRLDFSAHGSPDNLYIAAAERRAPKAGEIEIRVRAAGLNFRDVMWVMGMLPEEALEHGFAGPTIGMECAGEVAAVGEGVTGFAVGDKVIGFAPDCFAKYVTTLANAVAPMPDSLSFQEAATVPAVFFTAYYALCHLAQLEAGERVLIHGAAGGVGLAAIQIAKRCGAEIFGTAGSPEKRDILRLLGVDHVLDSRSLDFADEVMTITGGKGVDVVLNSLAGEAITKNLRILKPFGRFLEIGKRDLYANSKIGLRPFRNNLSYFGIDADTLLIERPALGRRLLREVLALFETGELHPLPYRSFPISRANEAFRQMQQSRQVGKLVVSMDDDEPGSLPTVKRSFAIRPDGTYLVTGGLSGFGLATAQWLVQKGARHLALVGRRGATTEEAQQGIAVMEAAGASVRAFPVDVSNEAAVTAMMTDIKATMPALRGVIHAAMVIDDCVLLNLDRERLHRVMAPKILGAWNLHRATLGEALDCFVLYSSGSTMLGNAGQANYVAANMYLEALAHYRRAQGLPALAIGWGPLSEVGYVARNAAVSEFLRNRIGVESMTPRQAVRELDRLLAADATNVCVSHFDWQRVSQVAPGSRLPRFSIVMESSGVGDNATAGEDLKTRLAELSAADRKDYLVNRLKEHIGRVVGTTAAQIDADRPVADMGLDSLMAVELGDAIERELKVSLPVMELIQAGSISGMADRILKQIGLTGEAAAPAAGGAAERERVEA
jgi:acyl transferase domain-containing protein/ubiquinone/menaquinone biosynthesis C-methylase UbiE/acyl carrier protein